METMELRERLAARSAESSPVSAEISELTGKLSRVQLEHAAWATVSDDLKSAAGVCECLAKRAKIMQQCKEASTTTSTTTCSALLTKRDDPENFCEALAL